MQKTQEEIKVTQIADASIPVQNNKKYLIILIALSTIFLIGVIVTSALLGVFVSKNNVLRKQIQDLREGNNSNVQPQPQPLPNSFSIINGTGNLYFSDQSVKHLRLINSAYLTVKINSTTLQSLIISGPNVTKVQNNKIEAVNQITYSIPLKFSNSSMPALKNITFQNLNVTFTQNSVYKLNYMTISNSIFNQSENNYSKNYYQKNLNLVFTKNSGDLRLVISSVNNLTFLNNNYKTISLNCDAKSVTINSSTLQKIDFINSYLPNIKQFSYSNISFRKFSDNTMSLQKILFQNTQIEQFENNRLTNLKFPVSLTNLKMIKFNRNTMYSPTFLNLSNNNLTQFKKNSFSNYLQKLDLDKNKLSTLSQSYYQMENLKYLHLMDNLFQIDIGQDIANLNATNLLSVSISSPYIKSGYVDKIKADIQKKSPKATAHIQI